MTATADAEAAANELMPLAEYLGSVLRRLRALPPLDLDLTQAHGNVLANDVLAPHPYPAFDQAAIDGYAARWEDLAAAGRIGSHPSFGAFEGGPRPVRLNVVGDLGAASWRPVRLTPRTCFSVAAGAPRAIGADVVV
ncbi:molybdopterin molybdenumtransferase MoeA, partial [Actinoplanes sp. NPDC048791]